jgi:ribonucleoside-diphosphate reductase alpha chain
MGHIRMMAAAQPFISGAISKTVNQPADATVEELETAYTEAWKAGLKAIALYREGCKRTQPVTTSKNDPGAQRAAAQLAGPPNIIRRKLPDERRSVTHKFSVAGHEGYIHVGLYENGDPGEIFVRMAKEGSTISGLMDSFATAISLALQYGVPLKLFVDKFSRTRFEPSGFTGNPALPRASSIMDYLFRWLGSKFVRDESASESPVESQPTSAAPVPAEPAGTPTTVGEPASTPVPGSNGHNGKNGNGHGEIYSFLVRSDSPTCPECGSITVPNGSCHKCINCGTTTGCS